MELLGIDLPTDGDLLVMGQKASGAPVLRDDVGQGVLRRAAADAWADLAARLPDVLRRELGKGDRFAEGFTLYDIDVRLSPMPEVTIQRTAEGDLVVHVVTGRNTIVATTTQPTFLGSYADPRFSVDFGLTFDYLIDIPPVAGPLVGSKILAPRFVQPHLDSQNFTGDLLLAVANVVAFFAGTSVDTLIDEAVREHVGEEVINARLEDINAQIQAYVDAGYTYLALLAGDPEDLMRQLGAHGRAVADTINALPAGTQSMLLLCREPDRSGVVEGQISWERGAGEPVDEATFALRRAMASPFMPQAALEALRPVARDAQPPAVDVPEPAGVHAESARLTAAVAQFSRAPSAAGLDEQSLAAVPSGVRLWDAAGQPEPAEASGQGFAGPLRQERPELRTLLGVSYEALTDIFRRGPQQFVVQCRVAEPGGGSHETGRMVAMWYDDDERWFRRRYRLEGVETDQPLAVSCELAPHWQWYPGAVDRIAPRNWTGTVTVHPALPLAELVRDGLLQVTVQQADGSRRTVAVAQLESAGALEVAAERAVVIESGVPADEASLNPQPLPPKWRDRMLRRPGADRAIIVVGGRPGDDASLNPQPLPPRWWETLADGAGGRLQRRNPAGPAAREVRRGAGRAGGLDGLVDALRRTPDVFLQRFDQRSPARREQVEVPETVAAPLVTTVDRFGDLVASVDPDAFLPDTRDPHGYGTVRGVDFRVWPA